MKKGWDLVKEKKKEMEGRQLDVGYGSKEEDMVNEGKNKKEKGACR